MEKVFNDFDLNTDSFINHINRHKQSILIIYNYMNRQCSDVINAMIKESNLGYRIDNQFMLDRINEHDNDKLDNESDYFKELNIINNGTDDDVLSALKHLDKLDAKHRKMQSHHIENWIRPYIEPYKVIEFACDYIAHANMKGLKATELLEIDKIYEKLLKYNESSYFDIEKLLTIFYL